MSHHVDLEGLGDLLLGLLQQRVSWHDSSVIDQDRDHTDLLLDLLNQFNNLRPARYVTAEEIEKFSKRTRGSLESYHLHISEGLASPLLDFRNRFRVGFLIDVHADYGRSKGSVL